MRVSLSRWSPEPGFSSSDPDRLPADLVLAFGPGALLDAPDAFAAVRDRYPHARIVGASTSGEILGTRASDGELAVMAVAFERTSVDVACTEVAPGECSEGVGRRLAGALAPADAAGRPLVHAFLLADGIGLNGSAFAAGLESALPDGVTVSGGLAADDDRFERTPLWADAPCAHPAAAAIGFYGHDLRVGTGAVGGWDTFGVERRVTRSEGNVLYELDGQPALALYESYLGPYAAELPASGLLFPLSVHLPGTDYEVVRTLLSVDREAGSVTFAGDVPVDSIARLMRCQPDRLIDGAGAAAQSARDVLPAPELALLVSCAGRKWAMGERTEEEVEEAVGVLGGVPAAGFYSYGELAPAGSGARCALHNQTMTVTLLSEA